MQQYPKKKKKEKTNWLVQHEPSILKSIDHRVQNCLRWTSNSELSVHKRLYQQDKDGTTSTRWQTRIAGSLSSLLCNAEGASKELALVRYGWLFSKFCFVFCWASVCDPAYLFRSTVLSSPNVVKSSNRRNNYWWKCDHRLVLFLVHWLDWKGNLVEERAKEK